jgi:hypothetical protein
VKPPPPPPPPPALAVTVIAPGVRVERRVPIPARLSFRIRGVERFSGRDIPPDRTNNPDACTLAWAYFPEWESGKRPFVVMLRSYKLITNDGKVREDRLLEGWRPDRDYLVNLRIGRLVVVAQITDTVTGQVWRAEQPFLAPRVMTVGLGWPWPPRPGCRGAQIEDVRWSA